jgi:sugar lactone lactonase YvrE
LRTLSGIPAGLAFDPHTGTLYVADTGNGRIARLAGVDERPGSMETIVGGLKQPGALAFAGGRLFVGELGTGTVHVYTRDGRLLQRLPTGIRRGDLTGIAVADDGSIYVLDARRRLLVRLQSSGVLTISTR